MSPQSTEEAANAVKRWYIKLHAFHVASKKMAALLAASSGALEQLDHFTRSSSLEDSQHLVLDEKFLRFIASVLSAVPLSGFQGKDISRKVASALLIAKYPDDVLGVAEAEAGSEISKKAICCQFWAALVLRYLQRIAKGCMSGVLQQLLLTLRHYLKHFDDWKALDAARMLPSLEMAFVSSYRTLLAAQRTIGGAGGDDRDNTDKEEERGRDSDREQLVRGAELQVQRVSQVLLRILGRAQGRQRIQQLSAEVEASTSEEVQQQQLPPSPTPAPPVSSSEEGMSRYLGLLSAIAGIGNEALAHEIALDPRYRLPSNTSSSSSNTPSEVLRRRLLAVLGDRLISALRRSNVTSSEELRAGMVVPVQMCEEVYSAKLLSSSCTPEGVLLWDVELLAEGVGPRGAQRVVRGVPSEAVVLASAPPRGEVLVSALEDLCRSIAQLTPNRRQATQTRLLQLIDREQLLHLLAMRALRPGDLLPLLLHLHEEVRRLMAEYREEDAVRWAAAFQEAFLAVPGGTLGAGGALLMEQALRGTIALSPPPSTPEGVQTEGTERCFEGVLLLLPLYLEHCTSLIEGVQRDLANYYISMLVPVLSTPQGVGAAFLAQRFQQHLLAGEVEVEAIAAFLSASCRPSALSSTLADLTDADALHTSSVVDLQQLLAADEGVDGVVAVATVKLLQMPVRLDSSSVLPATLAFDAKRLSAVRDTVDRVLLETCLTISCRQLLQRYGAPPRESEEVELQHRLDALLSDPEDGVNQLTIAAEVVRYIDFAIFRSTSSEVLPPAAAAPPMGCEEDDYRLQRHGLGYDAKQLEEQVAALLADLLSERNPIWQLLSKRIYRLLLRAMLGKPTAHKLSAYSLQSAAQERNLSTAMSTLRAVHAQNMRVHGQAVYAPLLQAMALQQQQPSV